MVEDIQADAARYELPLDSISGQTDDKHPEPKGSSVSEEALAANTLWFCRLRWIIIAILAGFGAFSLLGGTMAHLGLRRGAMWAFVCAGLLVICNLAYLLHIRIIGKSPRPEVTQANLWTQIVLDLLVLTAVVHFTGSLETHIANAYLFHIVLACIFFTPRQSSMVTILACGLFLICVMMETSGMLDPSQLHLDSGVRDAIDSSNSEILMHVASLWGILIAVWYLASKLSGMLRENQRDLSETNARLLAAQEERTRHMMHTAHELKSPCAAIYANARVLSDGYCGDLPDEAMAVVEKISHRCLGLSSQVQDMLKLADLRSEGSAPEKPGHMDAATPLKLCVEQVTAAANHRNIRIETDIQHSPTMCVEEHLKMFFTNLVSNAVNYSKDDGTVHITCKPGPDNRPHITIRDEGIGIPSEKLPRIFDEYFRTSDATKHNRGSSGLGLAIVQQIAVEHQIELSVESQLGLGTAFTAILPPDDAPPSGEQPDNVKS
ncbi:MAG: hypothetical protein HN350_08765 [Phycisphaerales bacterium]|jgi:two-component system, OmpR family, phosphate regulon sensor histidine kinase PhoR|nr:hypothetical protein [Phycisphaerales bacterium]